MASTSNQLKTIGQAGAAAYRAGRAITSNPWPPDTDEQAAWDTGFQRYHEPTTPQSPPAPEKEPAPMAKSVKESGNAGHNVDNVKKTIQEVAAAVNKLAAEKAEIQAQITEEKAKVKALGIKMTDFNIALRLQALEAEDRNESIDNLRIVFEALEIGGQSELFAATPAPA